MKLNYSLTLILIALAHAIRFLIKLNIHYPLLEATVERIIIIFHTRSENLVTFTVDYDADAQRLSLATIPR